MSERTTRWLAGAALALALLYGLFSGSAPSSTVYANGPTPTPTVAHSSDPGSGSGGGGG